MKMDNMREDKTDESACFHPFTSLFKRIHNKDIIFT